MILLAERQRANKHWRAGPKRLETAAPAVATDGRPDMTGLRTLRGHRGAAEEAPVATTGAEERQPSLLLPFLLRDVRSSC